MIEINKDSFKNIILDLHGVTTIPNPHYTLKFIDANKWYSITTPVVDLSPTPERYSEFHLDSSVLLVMHPGEAQYYVYEASIATTDPSILGTPIWSDWYKCISQESFVGEVFYGGTAPDVIYGQQTYTNPSDNTIINGLPVTLNFRENIWSYQYLNDPSTMILFDIQASQDASIVALRDDKLQQDSSIVDLRNWNISQDASIVALQGDDGRVDASLGKLFAWELSQDGSIVTLRNKDLTIDASLVLLRNWELSQDASISDLRTSNNNWNLQQDASIDLLRNKDIDQDASIVALQNHFISSDASIVALQGDDGRVDASLNKLFAQNVTQDASIVALQNHFISSDASIVALQGDDGRVDASLNKLFGWELSQDASISNLRTGNDNWNLQQDASIVILRGKDVDIDASLVLIQGKNIDQDASIVNLQNWNISEDASIVNLRGRIDNNDTSISLLNSWDARQDVSIRWLQDNIQPTGLTMGYVDGSLATRDGSINALFARPVADASLRVYVDTNFVHSSSTGTTLSWNAGILDVSIVADVTKIYVDSSLLQRDNSIAWNTLANIRQDASLNNTIDLNGLWLLEASIGSGFAWVGGYLTSSGVGYATTAYVDSEMYKRDVSISWLNQFKADLTYVDTSISNAIKPFATNASVGLALAPFATNASVGLAIQNFATNASVNSALTIFATNASVGLAIQNFATNASVNSALAGQNSSTNLAIAPLATNASVNLALLPFATNASVGLAIANFATNASINTSLLPFATNSSIASANFIKADSLYPYATNSSVGTALEQYATNASINSAAFLKQVGQAGGEISIVRQSAPAQMKSLNASANILLSDDGAGKIWIQADVSNLIPSSSIGASSAHSVYWNAGFLEASMGTGTGTGVSQAYVDGSLSTLNSSVNSAFGKVNSSINDVTNITGLFVLETSVGYYLGPYATNASVGLALAPFATNASVGTALANFSTNASVNTAISKLIPSASVGASSAHSVYWLNGFLEASMGSGVGVTSLVALTDVSIVSPANNQILGYDSATSKYKLKSIVDVSVFNVADASAYFPTIQDVSITYLKINDGSANYATRLTTFSSPVTTYAAATTDNNNIIDASGTFVITFPNTLPTGFSTNVINIGPGVITLNASTLFATDSSVALRDKYAGASIVCKATGIFYAVGNLK
jgi:hypothetical protein